ncbi:hypothetical protein F4818DRAFT_454902 [Hypoxylon cercidicola]|nr:hypothetical protein F4818DRAFT_454902 [Hypoxylon cercidicola]
MPLVLEEVKDEKDFDEILPVLYAAFGEPYNSLRRWFIPVHTTVDAAIEDAKARHIKSWKQHAGIHWVKVTDTDSGKIVGAAEWEIREQVSPPDEPQKPINAYWHIEGSEEKAFAEKLLMNLKGFMKERMTRSHIELEQLVVHPDYRKRGAGRLLTSWGLHKSDELGLETCVESVPFGVPIYEKYGFGNLECLNPDMAVPNPSARWKEYAADDIRVFLMWRPRLRGNNHVVNLIDIRNNPLTETTQVDQDDWIIMEWLSCGTLEDFIDKARMRLGLGGRLPNRLLWRFFLCLIRSCIAMAWPDSRESIGSGVESSGLAHSDLHGGNVLLGNPPRDGEHIITPILKLIDFGLATEWPVEGNKPGTQHTNIADIGKLMADLILLGHNPLPHYPPAQFRWFDGRKIKTNAIHLVPFRRGIDDLLLTLVCACSATEHLDRPTLSFLLANATKAVSGRTALRYGSPTEEDNAIIQLWQDIVYNAEY